MSMGERLTEILFPRKCILCRKLLERDELDLCAECRATAPDHPQGKLKVQFIDSVVPVWYYKDDVRHCLHRYKFSGQRFLAEPLGKRLAQRIRETGLDAVDLVTWVPISPLRKWKRGYDQDALLAKVVARELGLPCAGILKKVRHNAPQAGISGHAHRRANVLGVYRPVQPEKFQNASVLLVDDILTTGATASECARVLLTAGAREIHCAVIASAHHNTPR